VSAEELEQTVLYDLREPISSRVFRQQIEELTKAGITPYVVLTAETKYSPTVLFEIQNFIETGQIELGLASTWMSTEEMLSQKPKISTFTFRKLIDFDQETVIPANQSANPFVFITDEPGEMTSVFSLLDPEQQQTVIIQPESFSISTIDMFVGEQNVKRTENQTTFRYFQPVGPYHILEQFGLGIIIFFSVLILIFTITIIISRVITARKFEGRR
ncbi:MAG: hypothetical protein ACRC5Q_01755, partial [Culicoidibacterales bacterium]